MEFKDRRETWDHQERLDLQVNKETQDYRVYLVLKVPSDCQAKRVPRGKVACRDYRVSTALLVTPVERVQLGRKVVRACSECRGQWGIPDLAASREEMAQED